MKKYIPSDTLKILQYGNVTCFYYYYYIVLLAVTVFIASLMSIINEIWHNLVIILVHYSKILPQ